MSLSARHCQNYLRELKDLEVARYELRRLSRRLKEEIQKAQNFIRNSTAEELPASPIRGEDVILYRKYWGLVPVCTIYEYFEAGRCTELEGHEGAYNMYENELRMNRILGKLDEVIERLDDIAQNQRVLAESIQYSNRMVDRLSGSLKRMESSQELNTYYNKMSARNTRFLADYTVYRDMLL